MCGLMRNGYMLPTSIAFLAHQEHLDQIVAFHTKSNLEHLGYSVVRSYPNAPRALSSEKRAGPEGNAIWRSMMVVDDQMEADGKSKKARSEIVASEEPISPWGADVDLSGADFVLELRIRKFFADCNYLGVFAWCSANVAVCDAKSATRTVLFGRKIRGFGYGNGITPLEAYGIPINAAYWFMIQGLEKIVASPEFQGCLRESTVSSLK